LIESLLQSTQDLFLLSGFLIALNVGTLLLGASLLLSDYRGNFKVGWVLVVGSGLLLVLLAAFSTRLSPMLFDRYLVKASISTVLFSDPGIVTDLVFVAAAVLAWHSRRLGKWAWIVPALLVAYIVVRQLVAGSIPPLTEGSPVVVASLVVILSAMLAPQSEWLNLAPLAVGILTLGVLLLGTPLPVEVAEQIEEVDEVQEPASAPPVLANPDKFNLSLVAEFENPPTAIEVSPEGVVYVARLDGQVMQLTDDDHDGEFEQQSVFAADLGQALGLAYYEGRLFISAHYPGVVNSGRIIEAIDQDGDGEADDLVNLIEDLQSGNYVAHQNNDIAIGPDERLYIGVGSSSDHSPEAIPLAASILSSELDGSDVRVYARGFRNPYGLAFSREGDLYATDNSPDRLDETLVYHPPEELNLVIADGDYGFPMIYGDVPPNPAIQGAIHLFPAHSAVAGLTIYDGPESLDDYSGDIFVALWVGGRVVRVSRTETEDGFETEQFDFITNLDGPVDVQQGIYGDLFIAEFSTNRLYRVVPIS